MMTIQLFDNKSLDLIRAVDIQIIPRVKDLIHIREGTFKVKKIVYMADRPKTQIHIYVKQQVAKCRNKS